jgi:hypothetical protein
MGSCWSVRTCRKGDSLSLLCVVVIGALGDCADRVESDGLCI